VRDRVVTSVILAWPPTISNVCADQLCVTLPKASVVVEWISPDSVAADRWPTARAARFWGVSAL
jgi:hypothetical protein